MEESYSRLQVESGGLSAPCPGSGRHRTPSRAPLLRDAQRCFAGSSLFSYLIVAVEVEMIQK